MRLPYKTEDELLDCLAHMSESIRIDYYRRLEQSSVVALSAFLEKELSSQIESQVLKLRAQLRKVNLTAIFVLFVLAAITLAVDLPYGRSGAWFVAVFWLAYVGATELFFLPMLRIKQANHWNSFQKFAREWSSLLGNSGFAAHLSLVGTEYKGDVYEDAENVELAIKGLALQMASRASKG